MRFFGYGFILQVIAIVHFMKRRPDNYWIWIIFLGGPIGALAYIIAEMIPDLGLLNALMHGFSRRKRIRFLEAAVVENPSAGNFEELGDLLLEEKKYARARECFDEALKQRTDSLDPFYRRGASAFHLGDYASALVDLERVARVDPKYDYSRVQLLYAQSLAALRRDDEASAAFQRLLDSSSSTESLCAAAEFYADHHREKEAKELVDRIAARKVTMPAYQRRRERPWLRRASSLKRKLRELSAT